MGKIEARDLGEAGRAYLRAQLTGINVFCWALLDVVNSAPGDVFTLAPSDARSERLSEFERGGLLPQNRSGVGAIGLPDGSQLIPVVSLIESQITLLKETMACAGEAVCIADDVNPRWSDNLPYLGATAFGVGDEVYHLLTPGDSEAAFANAVSNKTLWHDVTAVCLVAPPMDQARTSTPSDLRQSAASAILITCAAYDGEGFVAWRRASSAGQ